MFKILFIYKIEKKWIKLSKWKESPHLYLEVRELKNCKKDVI